MAKMKYWNGTTWEILDAKDADTLDGKHYSDIKSEIQTVQNNFNTHQNNNVQHIKYAIASGTNTYTTTISGITSLTEGLSIKIKFTNANTGASTLNINGLGAKNIVKSNGNPLSSGNIKAGQICHLVYTGSVFQLLGEGGEYGTAQPQHVLEGYTIGTEEGIKEGTMVNQGAKIITPSTVNQAIPAGYHNGSGYVKGDSNLIASNIKKGVTIFGVTGTLEYLQTQSGTYTTSVGVPSFSISNLPFTPKLVYVWAAETGSTSLSQFFILSSTQSLCWKNAYYYGISYGGIEFKTYTSSNIITNGFSIRLVSYSSNKSMTACWFAIG